MTIRTFIALELPETVIDQIIQIRDENAGLNYKWEPRNKLHVTIKFIGDIDKNLIEKLSSEIETLIEEFNSFNLSFSNFGMFYKENKPNILWVGIKNNEKLSDFTNKLNNVCAEFGIEKERRKFKPHITLLRIKDSDNAKSLEKLLKLDLPEINFNADKVTIFKSELLPAGSVYKSIKSFYIKN